MNVKISDLMKSNVITARPSHSVDHLRKLMQNNKISALPIVDAEDVPVGIVSSTDLVEDLKGNTPASQIMTERVYKIPQYNDIHQAARMMRKHRIHHLVVTHEQKIVGILSSFDLLELVEDHRFTMKNAPTPKKEK